METVFGLCAAFGTAGAKTVTDLGTKFAITTLEERVLLMIQWIMCALVLTLAALVWHSELVVRPSAFLDLIGPDFWWVLTLDGGLNALAFYFYARAFRYGDASLVAPIMLVTPVLLLVTSPIMLGEHVPPVGAVGVITTVGGSYFLGKSLSGGGMIASFTALARHTGVQSMFLTALIWSVTANLDKIGVQSAPILVWSASISSIIALYFVGFWIVTPKKKPAREQWRATIPGLGNAVGIVLHVYALTILFVPYVIAIKRLSAALTVVLSGKLFGENIQERLAGVGIMLLGTVLMALGS